MRNLAPSSLDCVFSTDCRCDFGVPLSLLTGGSLKVILWPTDDAWVGMRLGRCIAGQPARSTDSRPRQRRILLKCPKAARYHWFRRIAGGRGGTVVLHSCADTVRDQFSVSPGAADFRQSAENKGINLLSET